MHTLNSTNERWQSVKHPHMCVHVCLRITGNAKAQNCQFFAFISTAGNLFIVIIFIYASDPWNIYPCVCVRMLIIDPCMHIRMLNSIMLKAV